MRYETGTATFTVDAGQALVTESDLVGGGAEITGNAITFDIAAGESYTQCAKCEKEIESTYAPERPEIIYCEECYLAEVY